ncbi:MAG: pentapeptide repeat-containing protein [Candidatus Nanopelagicales bacterium]|nr:pentapeptide repeat-containing protein [Candidatus Nanopelagicales bacterium]
MIATTILMGAIPLGGCSSDSDRAIGLAMDATSSSESPRVSTSPAGPTTASSPDPTDPPDLVTDAPSHDAEATKDPSGSPVLETSEGSRPRIVGGCVIAPRAQCAGANLRGADLAGADLLGADLAGANLRGADLAGANLRGADLAGANLRGANLVAANLERAGLHEADLTDANLRDAYLVGSILYFADFSRANLRGANLSQALIGPTTFDGADIRDSNMSGAHIFYRTRLPADRTGVTDPDGKTCLDAACRTKGDTPPPRCSDDYRSCLLYSRR